MKAAARSTHPLPVAAAGVDLSLPALGPEPFLLRAVEPAPCTGACPAGINVKAYVSLIAEERFAEALAVVRERCPLPGICGRVCHHPCEVACRRGEYDEPVAIRPLKRFVADLEEGWSRRGRPASRRRRGREWRPEKVAVIGAGPAGLTAAWDLTRAGFPVTVFEAAPEPGGMLRYGIASYRLPREVLAREIDVLLASGIDLRTGVRLGSDLDLERLLGAEFSALLLAVGAQRGRRLGLPGEDQCAEVEDALSFLGRVHRGRQGSLRGKVVVVGGGSTAIEAARTALRLGARPVEIVYRRARGQLLASPEEVAAAEAEGVRLRFLAIPVRLLVEGGRLRGVECRQVGLGERDRGGRRRPIPIPDSEFLLSADRVLAAIGQEPELAFLPPMVMTQVTEGGRLATDAATAMTRLFGVFAAGDAVTGPATVIEAVAAGHRAATSVRRYLLDGHGGWEEEAAPAVELGLPDPPPPPVPRHQLPHPRLPRSPGKRFAEVERAFTAAEAVAEARRCLRCGPCGDCRICATTCSRRHVLVRARMEEGLAPTALPVRVPAGLAVTLAETCRGSGEPVPGHLGAAPVEAVALTAHVRAELCRGCDRCREVCPFEAIQLLEPDKPESKVAVDPARCRGCGLCAAICPTAAVVAGPLRLAHSGLAHPGLAHRGRTGLKRADGVEVGEGGTAMVLPSLAALFAGSATAEGAAGQREVVLACRRRFPEVEAMLGGSTPGQAVLQCACTGEVSAGWLLDLALAGARRIRLATCVEGRCRYGQGAHLAAAEMEKARAVLELAGRPRDTLTCFPSELFFVAGRPGPAARTPAARGQSSAMRRADHA